MLLFEQSQNQLQRRRFARAVRAEETVDRAFDDLQVETMEGCFMFLKFMSQVNRLNAVCRSLMVIAHDTLLTMKWAAAC